MNQLIQVCVNRSGQSRAALIWTAISFLFLASGTEVLAEKPSISVIKIDTASLELFPNADFESGQLRVFSDNELCDLDVDRSCKKEMNGRSIYRTGYWRVEDARSNYSGVISIDSIEKGPNQHSHYSLKVESLPNPKKEYNLATHCEIKAPPIYLDSSIGRNSTSMLVAWSVKILKSDAKRIIIGQLHGPNKYKQANAAAGYDKYGGSPQFQFFVQRSNTNSAFSAYFLADQNGRSRKDKQNSIFTWSIPALIEFDQWYDLSVLIHFSLDERQGYYHPFFRKSSEQNWTDLKSHHMKTIRWANIGVDSMSYWKFGAYVGQSENGQSTIYLDNIHGRPVAMDR